MENHKKGKNFIGAGIFAAIAASLCCITPVLALFAGASGVASTFSWIEPFRPYLILITVLVLTFAWYQKLKPVKQEEIDCACEEDVKPSFWHSKKFLGMVTVFAAVMLAFPHYSYIFYPENKSEIVQKNQTNITESIFKVEGMTCKSCNQHVEHEVSLLSGYMAAVADYKTGTVKIKYDNTKSSKKEVVDAINKTGYHVVE
jgi:copper chaperone CopZ